MRLALKLSALLTALLPQAAAARPTPRTGDTFEISRVSETRFSGAGGSEGRTYDRDVLVERVVAVRDDGVELDYDLPSDTTAEERASTWQYPVRVLRAADGSLRLLNAPELEARVGRWLERAHWTRAMCGRWIFTWNAFQIQCDPAVVLETLAAFDVTAQALRQGAVYQDPLGAAPASLRVEGQRLHGAVFVAELAVDPEKLRRERAGSDAVLTQIMGDTPELRASRAARAPRRISGTINVRFAAGDVELWWRRTRVIRLEIEQADGQRETRTITETIERRPVAPRRR